MTNKRDTFMDSRVIQEKMKEPLDRRRFLKLLGAIGIGLSPLVVASPIKDTLFGSRLVPVTRTRPLMGTFVTITVLDTSRDNAMEAMEGAFTEIERLIPLLDHHSQDTPVAHLNRTGFLSDIAPEIHEVLSRAEYFYQRTHGIFDISVKPILDLLESHFSKVQEYPTVEEIKKALKRVGAQYIAHSQREIKFLRDGMEITLDGIAKGFIVDRAIALLKSKGIKHSLINAGGDIRALGDKGHGRPWKIGIQDPNDRNRVLQIVPLKNRAIATSGSYEFYFDADKKFHHIIDPQTGFSPQQLTSVSVLAPSLSDADALATAAFIPSRELAMGFIHAIPEAEGLFIHDLGAMTRSKGWPVT